MLVYDWIFILINLLFFKLNELVSFFWLVLLFESILFILFVMVIVWDILSFVIIMFFFGVGFVDCDLVCLFMVLFL